MQFRYLLIYIILINIIGYIIMLIDKKKAENGKFRIPEKNIFLLAFLGAELGIILGMKKFRHKLKKKSFIVKLIISIILQIIFIICILPH